MSKSDKRAKAAHSTNPTEQSFGRTVLRVFLGVAIAGAVTALGKAAVAVVKSSPSIKAMPATARTMWTGRADKDVANGVKPTGDQS